MGIHHSGTLHHLTLFFLTIFSSPFWESAQYAYSWFSTLYGNRDPFLKLNQTNGHMTESGPNGSSKPGLWVLVVGDGGGSGDGGRIQR